MPQDLYVRQTLLDEVTVQDENDLQLTLESQLKAEYNCQTPSEQSLTHIASINYVHYLKIQDNIKDCENRISSLHYAHGSCQSDHFHPYNPNNACNSTKLELLRFNILSKDLDRAYRHFINSINMLRMMKQAPIQVNIKARTAVVGQNQVVQTNSSHE